MNKSKHIDPEQCLTCGQCCSKFTISYPKNSDKFLLGEIERFKLLATDKIVVKEEETRFIVEFLYSCTQLLVKKGKFRCNIYKDKRPLLCEYYPFENSTECPHLNDNNLYRLKAH